MSWSVKVSGLTAAVRKKIIAWPNPTDDLNGRHFTAAQGLIDDMLVDMPGAAVSVQASGHCAHDGRSTCSIQIDPLELVIGDVIEKAEAFDRLQAAAAASPIVAVDEMPRQSFAQAIAAVDQAPTPAPAVDQAPTPAADAPAVATVDPSTLSDHERAALKSAGV